MQTFSWNDRAQPTALQVNSGATSLLTLHFYPCSSQATSCATGNNGNLQSQTIALPNLSLTQIYTYDNLNRLTAATESGGPGWTQNYGYDVNRNRWLVLPNDPNLPLTLETPTGTSATTSSWYSTSNRINTWTYDAAGNVLGIGSMTRSFTYDAENRQVTACINCQGNIPNATYTYDGADLRVSKLSAGRRPPTSTMPSVIWQRSTRRSLLPAPAERLLVI